MHAYRPICFLLLLIAAPLAAQTPATMPLLPVPSAALLAQNRDMIHTLYKSDFAKKGVADRLALASLLLNQARETTDDPAARYVALAESADLAAGAGDARLAFSALDQLARWYAIDLPDLQKSTLLRAHAAAAGAADSQAITTLALETATRASERDDFTAVLQLADLAEAAANKTRQVAVVASIQTPLANLRDLAAEFSRVRAAFARLDKNPDPAAAAEDHLTIGRFYALRKNQWPLGLPHLAQSSDATLRDLATRELSHPADGLMQVQLGDAWWDYAHQAPDAQRPAAAAHAALWYKTAQATIQGITLARIQSRLQTAGNDQAPKALAPPTSAGTINLLALIDPARDAAQGKWSLAGAAASLAVDSSSYATLQLPYQPPDEFDLAAAFTRTEGAGPIALLIASHGRSFGYALDLRGEARFERVDGKIARDNPTVTPVSISNGHRYTLAIQVRKDAVRALLDGKIITEWKTDFKDLTRYSVWKLNDTTLCGIGANNAKVTFHTITLTEITGKGKSTR